MPQVSRMGLIAACAALLLSVVPAALVYAASADSNHTQAHFTAKHLLISTVQGYIPVKSVQLTIGANNIPTSVQATLDPSKLNTNNDQRDGDLRSDKFFDVQHFPTMTFASTSITPQSGGAFTMNGNLTIHGVTKPVVVNGNVVGTVKDNEGKTHVGYAATATVDRSQFGVGSSYPDAVVSNAISITIECEAIL